MPDKALSNPSRLDRFLTAQAPVYARALAELEQGRKQSHWMWFVLPQLCGLGTSKRSRCFGIADLAEARAYLEHPVLGSRLRESVMALCAHRGSSAAAILGTVDAIKFRSCLTLFAAAAADPRLFDDALQQFFSGEGDAETLRLLEAQPRP